ncbi:MAG: DNA-binding protein [Flavobacterium lindanitolerans]|uniref:DNA-binding protein n=1 Tax=Flavobacterium lindanitolerans TaxID=428988 RepID=UPI001A59FD4E|nr:DNA-binding protein [Flavobacterium lindanitolerans]MBL7867199.1 DNA-binding protein [Flavobacterium lindanitolerans]
MKPTTIEEAKSMAKAKSLEVQYKDEAIYIIYCNRTKQYYVDTDSLIRLWELLVGYYENGVFTSEKSHT